MQQKKNSNENETKENFYFQLNLLPLSILF